MDTPHHCSVLLTSTIIYCIQTIFLHMQWYERVLAVDLCLCVSVHHMPALYSVVAWMEVFLHV